MDYKRTFERESGTQLHPECGKDEVFFTNTWKDRGLEGISGYASMRKGRVAYNVYGDVVENLSPVFVSKKEWGENEKRIAERKGGEGT